MKTTISNDDWQQVLAALSMSPEATPEDAIRKIVLREKAQAATSRQLAELIAQRRRVTVPADAGNSTA